MDFQRRKTIRQRVIQNATPTQPVRVAIGNKQRRHERALTSASIAPSNLPHIYTPFDRLARSRRHVARGLTYCATRM